jgi:transposase
MPRRRQPDPKLDALRASGTLNPRPAGVADETFRASDFFDARDLVQVKYEMLRRVRVERTPVTRAAAAFGVSRPTFYQAQAALAHAGLGGLVPRKRGRRSAHKLTPAVMAYVTEARTGERPSTAALVQRIAERFGVTVHPRSVERAVGRAEKNGPECLGTVDGRAVIVRARLGDGLRGSPPCGPGGA